jgi:hypothetical protein
MIEAIPINTQVGWGVAMSDQPWQHRAPERRFR